MIFCLSFADRNGWLGGAIVDAENIIGAAERCSELGFNPGGEVFGVHMPDSMAPEGIEKFKDRLLTKDDLRELDKLMGGQGGLGRVTTQAGEIVELRIS